ncbi:MAG: right-handed parallel beta-helix repeat-containing protein [Flavobacteriales bacterium]|nr:right-handed parallel beta-helix repeat-containing protein [Flavobacteriales bacterium]
MRTKAFIRAALGLLLGLPLQVHGVTYYLSPSGNDANNGTSQSSPWRTIDRLNLVTGSLQPGDRIYFERGGTYRGEVQVNSSGTSSAPIIIGAYGSGNRPIITGSELVTGWTVHAGQIWRAQLARSVKMLFSNGQLQTLARYPNAGWLRNDAGSTSTLYDNALTQSAGYWTGATAVIRSTGWCYEMPTITSFNSGTLSFPAIQHGLGNDNWGYFLCNKLSELDSPGEWYHDGNTGILYFWAPGGVSPSTLSVEASTFQAGIKVGYQQRHINIAEIELRHQQLAGIHNDGGYSLTVQGCRFLRNFYGIRSYGNSNSYLGNEFMECYASGALLIDHTTTFSGNTMDQIGLVPGSGVTNWSHFGVEMMGNNNIIRNNQITGTGYSGLFIKGNNVLVERNVIRDALKILNDGGAIVIDRVDALSVVDNIISGVHGDLASAASTNAAHYPIAHGIYFGNDGITNSWFRHNTVRDCKGSGIHVDHTMINSGNHVKDNVLFNNKVQMSISDLSNNVGPGAVAPYQVAAFNTVYEGNIMYSLNMEQLCMDMYNVWSTSPVDFGTFANNRYYSPYEELSIRVVNMVTNSRRRYTLERWQVERTEDAGSTASPQRLNAMGVTGVIGGNLVANGTFDTNVSGWTCWPGNGQLTQSTAYLDAGSMRVNLPNASLYTSLYTRSNTASVTNGHWYRLKFAIQSSGLGEVDAGLKGQAQLSSGATIHSRAYPFSPVRRDLELIFQGNLTDQAMAQFVNHHTEPTYWIDNVELHRVQVQVLDPTLEHILMENPNGAVQSFTLPAGCWKEVEGASYTGTIDVQPYRSRVFYRTSTSPCAGGGVPAPSGSVFAKVLLRGAISSSTGTMRADLRPLNLVPLTEPYTAMGYSLANAGAAFSTAAQLRTGLQTVVDWVLLELRNTDAAYSLAERRVALVCRDGEVITPDGATSLPFSVTAQGKHLVVLHRNHLGAMTASPLASNGGLVDYTSLTTALYGTDAMFSDGTRRMLWQANAVDDNVVRYTGVANDRDPILAYIGGVATQAVSGYSNMDLNMDGWVKYSGPGNDRDQVLVVIGGAALTAVRIEQVP